MTWFSAKLRIVLLFEKTGASRYMDSVHLFQANDFEEAMRVALAIGKRHEEEYRNEDGELVRWRLKEVVSLDVLGPELVDGVEVYSEPVELEEGCELDFNETFEPEQSVPTQTVFQEEE